MSRNSQVSRIISILGILEGASQGLTVNEIESRAKDRGFDASKRTIYRDLEALNQAGLPIYEKDDDSRDSSAKVWVIDRTTKINQYLVLTPKELVSLYLARGVLSPLRDTPFFEDLESIFNKISEKLGYKSRDYLNELQLELKFEPGPRWGLGIDPDTVETIRAAITEKQVLSCTYNSVNSNSIRTRKLGPQFLYFAKGSMYLVAEDLEDAKVKVFAVPRMSNAQMQDMQYTGSIVDPEIYFNDSFGVFTSSDPVDIKLEFSREVAQYVRERKWHSSQRVVAHSNGTITMYLSAGLTPELIQFVIGFGENVKVLEPKELKEKLIKTANEIIKLYVKKAA